MIAMSLKSKGRGLERVTDGAGDVSVGETTATPVVDT